MDIQKSITIDNRCEYIRPDGSHCEAKKMLGSRFCFFHNPEVIAKRLDARRRGGLARHGSTKELGIYEIRRPIDILQVLQDCLNETVSLEASASKSKTIAYIAQVLIRGFEASEIENRLRSLEERVYNKTKCR